MSASNVCPSCGVSNAPVNTFCVNCGTRLIGFSWAGAPPPGPSPYSPPMPTAYPGGYPPYPGVYPAYPYAPPPRGAGFGEMISGTFGVWTKNFVNFFAVWLALALATNVMGLVLSRAIVGTFAGGSGIIPGTLPSTPSGIDLAAILLYAAATVVVSAILNSIVVGGMTEYAVRRLRGEAMTLEQALRRGIARFLSILGANILLTAILFGLVLLPVLLMLPLLFVAAQGGGGAAGALAAICGLFLALIVGVIVAVFVYVSLCLYAPAIMMENQTAVGGLSRSWALTRGHRWPLFGSIVVVGFLAAVLTSVFTVPAGLTGNLVVSTAAAVVATALVGPWLAILLAVAYDLIARPMLYSPLVPPVVPPAPAPQPPGP